MEDHQRFGGKLLSHDTLVYQHGSIWSDRDRGDLENRHRHRDLHQGETDKLRNNTALQSSENN